METKQIYTSFIHLFDTNDAIAQHKPHKSICFVFSHFFVELTHLLRFFIIIKDKPFNDFELRFLSK
jgi:hypothetical protein